MPKKHRSKFYSILCFGLCLLLLAGCASEKDEGVTSDSMDKESIPSVSDAASDKENESFLNDTAVTAGTEEYQGFVLDNVLHSETQGDIHYNIYTPEGYDGSHAYALYLTLPGYEGLYFQGIGVNLKSENFAFEAQKYIEDMIIVAPQLNDWGETSANQTIVLTEYLISHYNVDTSRIFANGYSGGGETMSLVVGKRPDLFTAYLQVSSKWDGAYEPVVDAQLPVYLAIGESDEYYSSEPTKNAYETLHSLYEAQGLSNEEIDRLLVLDIKEHDYFTDRGVNNEHGGGGLFATDAEIMGWLFGQRKETAMISTGHLPAELAEIPSDYFVKADNQGTLVDLYYDTYESFTYEQQKKTLHKRAVVYLPYGYNEEQQYNVLYLMHGGWSNETTNLGIPDNPNVFKNVLDNAIAGGKIQPMIVVCPSYNNESESDSGDYSLALQLTNQYHNELIHDLIPSVEGKYSTYAKNTDENGIRDSRDHRAFCGFSMGSVATWRTFEHCLDYFRYFMPFSGSLTTNGNTMAAMVKDSGHEWNDFFIFAASGTDDFAYSAFKMQIEAMATVADETFHYADNERDGNLYFLEKEGGTHSGEYAMQYLYNGLCWIWNTAHE